MTKKQKIRKEIKQVVDKIPAEEIRNRIKQDEQEEAIKILEHIKKEFKGSTKAPNINIRNIAIRKIQAIDTVLNMLKEKDEEIEKLKAGNKKNLGIKCKYVTKTFIRYF